MSDDASSDATVDMVMEICGCTREAAARAVEAAGPGGVELAVDLVLSTQSAHWASANEDALPPLAAMSMSERANLKMVCLVRRDLGMGVGKVAAQVAHAALGAVKATGERDGGWDKLRGWEAGGEAVIVLEVTDHAQLEGLLAEAAVAGLTTHCVADAGRTEVAPGTHTVGAIGPDLAERVDPSYHPLVSPFLSSLAQVGAIGPDFAERVDAITGRLSLLA